MSVLQPSCCKTRPTSYSSELSGWGQYYWKGCGEGTAVVRMESVLGVGVVRGTSVRCNVGVGVVGDFSGVGVT